MENTEIKGSTQKKFKEVLWHVAVWISLAIAAYAVALQTAFYVGYIHGRNVCVCP